MSIKLPYVKKPCKDCPFRKDCLRGWLSRSRMDEILESDTFVCHKNTDLQCAGHMLIKGNANAFVRLANRLGFKMRLRGRELVFDTEREAIEHHGR